MMRPGRPLQKACAIARMVALPCSTGPMPMNADKPTSDVTTPEVVEAQQARARRERNELLVQRDHERRSIANRPVAIGIAVVGGILAALLRVVPHPPNFSAVGGLGIFG